LKLLNNLSLSRISALKATTLSKWANQKDQRTPTAKPVQTQKEFSKAAKALKGSSHPQAKSLASQATRCRANNKQKLPFSPTSSQKKWSARSSKFAAICNVFVTYLIPIACLV
jgi:hypothetical protein